MKYNVSWPVKKKWMTFVLYTYFISTNNTQDQRKDQRDDQSTDKRITV